MLLGAVGAGLLLVLLVDLVGDSKAMEAGEEIQVQAALVQGLHRTYLQ
jgi:hypothetical protein